jgi:hypothetical protein
MLLFMGGIWPAGSARAWPVHAYVDVEVGGAKILPLRAASWAEVEDPRVASVELLPHSAEVLLSGHSPGRTVILFSQEGLLYAWRIQVARQGLKVQPALGGGSRGAAQDACPGLTVEAGRLRSEVKSEKCRAALLELFKTDDFRADQVALTFDVSALQAQLSALDAAFAALGQEKPAARYLGAGLVLEGNISPANHRRVLWQVFFNSIGGLALDDQLEPLGERK